MKIAFSALFALSTIAGASSAATVTYTGSDIVPLDEGMHGELPAFDPFLGALRQIALNIDATYIYNADYAGIMTAPSYQRGGIDISTQYAYARFEATDAYYDAIRAGAATADLFDTKHRITDTTHGLYDYSGVACPVQGEYCEGSLRAEKTFRTTIVIDDPVSLAAFSAFGDGVEVTIQNFYDYYWPAGNPGYFNVERSEKEFLSVSYSYDIAPVPLPASLPLLAVGLGALGLAGRRRAAR